MKAGPKDDTSMPAFHPRRLAPLALGLAVLGGPVVALAQKPPEPAKEDPTKRASERLKEAQKKRVVYHLDWDKADILEVIKYISTWTGKNFILPDNVRGKITIIGPDDVTADEAYEAFLAALESNNLTITPTGKFYKIVPKKDSTRTDICTIFGDDEKKNCPDDERMTTRVFRLKYSESDPIKNVLQQFVSREGEIVPFAPNMLIVSDTGLNMKRLARFVEQLDQPGSTEEINVLQVEHGSAQELANMLLQIFQPQQGGSTGGARKPSIAMSKEVPAKAGETAPIEAAAPSVSKMIPDERSNKIIVIASARSFERIRDLVKKLDVPTDTGQVHVHYLENADAEEIAGTLQALAQGQSSGGGSRPGRRAGAQTAATPAPAQSGQGGAAALFSGEIKVTADKGTNSLLIIASPSDYRNMKKVIERLDIRRRQVFIEAVIMEVKLNSENRLSVDAHGGVGVTDVQFEGTEAGTVPIFFGSEVSKPAGSIGLTSLAGLSGFLAGVQGPPLKIDSLGGLQLPAFGVVLNALQKNDDVNVISTPHLLTSDNEEAEISVGSNVPFQAAYSPNLGALSGLSGTGTSAVGGLSSLVGGIGGLGSLYAPIQRQPVELRLKLKPQINESDFVRLEIDEQIEEIASSDPQLGPTTAKRSVKTTVVAKDQATVVIGGLIQERLVRSENKVPILGSLPVIGTLFRSTTTRKDRTNLLLFLTPYIIRDQSDFRRIFERKMKERQEFVARFFGSTESYSVNIDWERKRGPLALLSRNINDTFQRVENGGQGAPDETVVTPATDEPIPVPPGAIQPAPGAAEPPAAPAEPASPEPAPPPPPVEPTPE